MLARMHGKLPYFCLSFTDPNMGSGGEPYRFEGAERHSYI